MEQLGKQIFFDRNLSQPRGQSCASCHDPDAGFASPNSRINATGSVIGGARLGRFGNRRPPTAAYATETSSFDGSNPNRPSGGTFWDGRATGEVITAEVFPAAWSDEAVAEMSVHFGPGPDQAMGPFLNDVEMNLPSARSLCRRIQHSHYADLWLAAWGEDADPRQADRCHKRAAFSIAVYEASSEVNSFSSFRDIALQWQIENRGGVFFDESGHLKLELFTPQENMGHTLFHANRCAGICHSSDGDGTSPKELFVNRRPRYFNIGAPANPMNPWYGMDTVTDDNGEIINIQGTDWVDLGIGLRPEWVAHSGKVKTPTLRNVDKRLSARFVKAFTHNGYFKSLKGVVHFYNSRDVTPTCTIRGHAQRFVPERRALRRGCWPLAEYQSPDIVGCDAGENCKVLLAAGETFETYCDNPENPRGIGNLCLSEEEEDAIVAYLSTLSDTIEVAPPSR